MSVHVVIAPSPDDARIGNDAGELAWFRSFTTRAFGADRSRWPEEDREWIEQQEAKEPA